MEEIYTNNLSDGTTEEVTAEPLSVEGAQIQALSALADTAGALSRAVSKIAAYVPTQWRDFAPPDINAANLLHIENGIKTATDAVNNAIDSITSLNSSVSSLNNRIIHPLYYIKDISLTEYLQANLVNKHYGIFLFANLTDNPFTFGAGTLLAYYHGGYSSSIRLLAFSNEGQIEVATVPSFQHK